MQARYSPRAARGAGLFAALCLAISAAAPANAGWNDVCSGTATYTSSGYSGGALLLDPIDPTATIAALNPTQLNDGGIQAALAGAYLQVQGPRGTVTVYVTDLYPEGADCGLDLSPNAFAAIGDTSAGRIPIRWQVVAAPVTGNVVYRIKEGSSQYWAAIQVRNHRYPVVKFEYRKNGDWVSLPKTAYNHFVGEQMGAQLLEIRLTDIRGQVVTDTLGALPSQGDKGVYFADGHVQFPR
ncbi:expansin EXLX1 family cellulose-binding protein [uncultured Xanthomonas sp.]|uniref:expansin EXLX1 family cellulose-binding protein n=1 Tax=uncultured Xanthomonas sp. TaxID=152831 RepID=UPI003747FE41